MDYAAARSSQLPIGNGAVESAIRRVINLRVKSNATYWLRENAEAMIRLRAWIKAGRRESLFQQTTSSPLTLACIERNTPEVAPQEAILAPSRTSSS